MSQIISLGSGKCSSFGGPDDGGVQGPEGLGLIQNRDLAEWWFSRCFLKNYDHNFGLARNLNPSAYYLAMRFAYTSFGGVQGEILNGYSLENIRRGLFKVGFNGKYLYAQAVDWGPNQRTGRLVDLSPEALTALGARTDDIVSVEFIAT